MLKKIIAAAAIVVAFLGLSTNTAAAEIKEYFFINKNGVEVTIPSTSSNDIVKELNFSEQVLPLEVGAVILDHTLNIYNGQICLINPMYISYGVPLESKRTIRSLGVHKVTTYCSCSKCCGKGGGKITAAGTVPTVGRTIGCNWLPLGTHVIIEGHEYIVEDRGASWVKGFDIYWGNDHHAALHSGFGRKIEVFIVEE